MNIQRAYSCGCCGNVTLKFSTAENCCGGGALIEEGFQCGVCEKFHSYRQDAENCCDPDIQRQIDAFQEEMERDLHNPPPPIHLGLFEDKQ
jgi:hypothetical protein